MKKIFAVFTFLFFCGFTSVMAQPPGGGDPAARKAAMKERIKPQLIEQTKLTDEQADKVIDIYWDAQMESGKLRRDESMSQEDKDKKTKEITDGRDKKLKDIPLTDDQVKAVNTFYDDMRKKMQQGGNRPQRPAGN